MKKTGRPKTYRGTQVGVKLPLIMDLKIRSEAERVGKTLSDVIRETLEPVFGDSESQQD